MDRNLRLVSKLLNQDVDEGELEALIIAIKKTKISEERKSSKGESSSMSGLDKLALKSSKYYKEKIGLSP